MNSTCQTQQAANESSVGMGQIVVAQNPNRLGAVLGSCVGIALYHPRLRVGALAHVVLPCSNGQAANPGKYADTAVSHMLCLLRQRGVETAGLLARLVGGAMMFGPSGAVQIGRDNVLAATEALQAAGIRVAAQDVGGQKGRRITLDCRTGQLTVQIVGRPPKVL